MVADGWEWAAFKRKICFVSAKMKVTEIQINLFFKLNSAASVAGTKKYAVEWHYTDLEVETSLEQMVLNRLLDWYWILWASGSWLALILWKGGGGSSLLNSWTNYWRASWVWCCGFGIYLNWLPLGLCRSRRISDWISSMILSTTETASQLILALLCMRDFCNRAPGVAHEDLPACCPLSSADVWKCPTGVAGTRQATEPGGRRERKTWCSEDEAEVRARGSVTFSTGATCKL